jgi:hypothetical protein
LATSPVQHLLAANRIPVERTLASVKRLRILRDEFRNRRPGMVDEVMAIRCTLHNFRCELRQWIVAELILSNQLNTFSVAWRLSPEAPEVDVDRHGLVGNAGSRIYRLK